MIKYFNPNISSSEKDQFCFYARVTKVRLDPRLAPSAVVKFDVAVSR